MKNSKQKTKITILGILSASITPLIIILLDQITKILALKKIITGKYTTILYNSGITFGILPGSNSIMIIISIIATGVISYATINSSKLQRIGYGLILGGIIGNLIDRIRIGAVIDFIHVKDFPVFNIADSAIVTGVILILLIELTEDIITQKSSNSSSSSK